MALNNDELLGIDFEKSAKHIIKVIGVGGGGGNAVKHMFKCGIKDVDFILANTDAQALRDADAVKIDSRIQLGASLTQGLGAGNQPEQGRQAAIESLDEVKAAIGSSDDTKMLFITAGMGGGTGTGAAPVIAATSTEDDILTVGIVTIPFRFEGPKRVKQALEGLNKMYESVDAMLVIDNEKIREIYGSKTFSEAFAHADDILTMAAKSIAEIITKPGKVNVDFADVRTVMKKSGVALMGVGRASGEGRAEKAAQQALNSPLLNNNDIKGAKNLLVYVTSSEEMTLDELGFINEYIQSHAGNHADLIWGNAIDESLESAINVTVVATGFEHREILDPYINGAKNTSFGSKKLVKPEEKKTGVANETSDDKQQEKKTSTKVDDNVVDNKNTSDDNKTEKLSVGESREFEIETIPETDADKSNEEEQQLESTINDDIEEAVMKTKFKTINFGEITDLSSYDNTPAYLRLSINIATPLPPKYKSILVDEN